MKNEFFLAIDSIVNINNSEKFIGEAIESILNQTFKNFEFIIINDGSTDKTLEIIKSYAKYFNLFRFKSFFSL